MGIYRSDLPHLIEDFVRPSQEARFLIATLAAFSRVDTNVIYRQPETMQLWSSVSSRVSSLVGSRASVQF